MNKQKLGILGGGQLARMLLETARLPEFRGRLETFVLDQDPAPTAGLVDHFVTGDFRSPADVVAFGASLDRITVEIESVSTTGLAELEARGIRTAPSAKVLEIVQDKGKQKMFFRDHAIASPEFVLLEDPPLELAFHKHLLPAALKLRTGGYDGRGVELLHSSADFPRAFQAPSVLEGAVAITKEISVIVARTFSGEQVTYPTVEMVMDPVRNQLDCLLSPAELSLEIENRALTLAGRVASTLGVVGLLAVEMFVDRDGAVWVNEVAPRPHNSGHHSIEANRSSQYAQLLHILLGDRLGPTDSIRRAAMKNIVGPNSGRGVAQWRGIEKALACGDIHVHNYGKRLVAPGRKMGHITALGNTAQEAQLALKEAASWVQVEALSSSEE